MEAAAQGLEAVRPHMTRGFAIAALIISLLGATWWAAGQGLLGANSTVAVLALLVALDEARVDAAFIQTLEFEAFADPDPTAELLRARAQAEPPFRVLSWLGTGRTYHPPCTDWSSPPDTTQMISPATVS